jgi:hypothetical protein
MLESLLGWKQMKRFLNKKAVSAAIIALMIVAGAAYAFASGTNPLPRTVRKQASYTLYYPAKLPAGYSFDQSTARFADGVVTYSLSGPGGHNVLVSEQSPPGDFDVENFNAAQIKERTTIQTPNGTAYVGTVESNRVASQVSQGTWILITGPKDVTADSIGAIISSLKAE